MRLPSSFLARPFAHRGLHDVTAGRAENSPGAFAAAIGHGYGIELDLQLSKDGQAMVFHDYDLERLAGIRGAVAQKTALELSAIALLHDGDAIPTLSDVLAQVSGQVPLLIEIKDQDGGMGPNVGKLEMATANLLRDYQGDVAVMSFNPHSVAAMRELLPDTPRGLTTCRYKRKDWPTLKKLVRHGLRKIPNFADVDASFISHDRKDLDRGYVRRVKKAGYPVLTWTIKSPAQEAEARKIADNITFEGYLA
ncbi:Glycerophosphoryl diester phosphodiesterase [Cognatiyoonia koreensis]|uniref:Glycerophosphoryl diester phosphodiesterase n=1 Tax=Cognatiyoonia koreensis TaxID=364200 RepID=A0A1I0RF96_9RHOB|nr:glycerophosphodiester phosphodiesterase family protein [Cognatiyoonia koreensis]SEW39358.1 Glycerophosphoryl diester phosphodiesterase [Cognatiyoonia koreensis]